MRFHHRFTVAAPLSVVRDFHSRSASMGAITPPPVIVQVHHAPEQLAEGDEMDFTMWLGPLPIRWRARIEQVTPVSFVDRQIEGPFAQWVHLHSFAPLDERRTEVVDDLEIKTSSHRFWRLVGWGMQLNLPVLFAYRQWKTRRLLEHPGAQHFRPIQVVGRSK
jgi:ligand-binding SRPBCC domain-containing protein